VTEDQREGHPVFTLSTRCDVVALRCFAVCGVLAFVLMWFVGLLRNELVSCDVPLSVPVASARGTVATVKSTVCTLLKVQSVRVLYCTGRDYSTGGKRRAAFYLGSETETSFTCGNENKTI
jgi:hypothetical protein